MRQTLYRIYLAISTLWSLLAFPATAHGADTLSASCSANSSGQTLPAFLRQTRSLNSAYFPDTAVEQKSYILVAHQDGCEPRLICDGHYAVDYVQSNNVNLHQGFRSSATGRRRGGVLKPVLQHRSPVKMCRAVMLPELGPQSSALNSDNTSGRQLYSASTV